MRASEFIHDATGFAPTDHVCWLHDGAAEVVDVVTPFLREGLARGEQLAYVSTRTRRALRRHLAGIADVDRLVGDETITLEAVTELLDVERDPASAVSNVRALVERALEKGFTGLRMFTDATPLLPFADWLAQYEVLVDGLARSRPITLLCAFSQRAAGPDDCSALAALHPASFGGPGFWMVRDGRTVEVTGSIAPEAVGVFTRAIRAVAAAAHAAVHVDLGACGDRPDGLDEVLGDRSVVASVSA